MDERLREWVNGSAGSHPGLDGVMRFVAERAEIVFIALVAAWFLAGLLRRDGRDRLGAACALLAAGAALAANQVISHLAPRARPVQAHPGDTHLLVSASLDPSFPSDHAAAAVAVAVALVAVRWRLGIVVLAAALLVCVARVYVGAHYPGDVAAGALVGLAAGLLVRRLAPVIGARLPLPERLRWLAGLPPSSGSVTRT